MHFSTFKWPTFRRSCISLLILTTIFSCSRRNYSGSAKNDQAFYEYVKAYHNLITIESHRLTKRLYKIPYELGDEFDLDQELYIGAYIADTTVWIDLDTDGIILPKGQRIQLIDLKKGSYHIKALDGEHSKNELLFIAEQNLTDHMFPDNIAAKAELLSREIFVRDSLRDVVSRKFNLTLQQLEVIIQNRR
jgi:hypothetical protein